MAADDVCAALRFYPAFNSMMTTTRLGAPEPSFRELFTPKLTTVFREGYDLRKLQADALAGLTVAIVALPLSMAIAIASGAPPERGLYTAIIGGFLISALGGSRFQIGGPAGAFIVLVAATIERHGYDGFLIATMIAGVALLLLGFLKLGTYIKYIPHPVIVGFTAGIAVIIFASQLRDLFGLTLAGKEPGAFLPKLEGALGGRRHLESGRRRDRRGQHRHHPRPAPLSPDLAGLPDRGRARCRG
jgi:sulfate permease, SulP family